MDFLEEHWGHLTRFFSDHFSKSSGDIIKSSDQQSKTQRNSINDIKAENTHIGETEDGMHFCLTIN